MQVKDPTTTLCCPVDGCKQVYYDASRDSEIKLHLERTPEVEFHAAAPHQKPKRNQRVAVLSALQTTLSKTIASDTGPGLSRPVEAEPPSSIYCSVPLGWRGGSVPSSA